LKRRGENRDRLRQLAVTGAARAARRLAELQLEAFVERLRVIVDIDSGFDSPGGREEVARQLAAWGTEADFESALVETEAGGHVVVRLPGAGHGRIVLLGHHDTVFERGTAARRPFRREGAILYGPGVADMKGGLLTGLLAMESLAMGERAFETVEFHSVPDEEVRSAPFAASDLVGGADAALVLECGRENGDLVIARKASAWLRVRAEGRSAHAGSEPERGVSAVLGLCRHILRCDALNGARPGLTVVTSAIKGGAMANVVPDRAEAMLDIRADSNQEVDWALREIASSAEGGEVHVTTELDGRCPAMEPTVAAKAMYAEARRLAVELGSPVGGQTAGGMSDGCWTAHFGVPTLDGFGPAGGHDHSPEEYMLLPSVPQRCGIIAGLCQAIGDGLLDGVGSERGDGQ